MDIPELLSNLRKFLFEAREHGYGAGEKTDIVDEPDGSHNIRHESADGKWKYHDKYWGGEPYGGREIVSVCGKAIWVMLYYGRVKAGVNHGPIYDFLRRALHSGINGGSQRGPPFYQLNDMIYTNEWSGGLENFRGDEFIWSKDKKVYEAWYGGGLIDR